MSVRLYIIIHNYRTIIQLLYIIIIINNYYRKIIHNYSFFTVAKGVGFHRLALGALIFFFLPPLPAAVSAEGATPGGRGKQTKGGCFEYIVNLGINYFSEYLITYFVLESNIRNFES